jgi:DNA-binding CsgD family transcriptional regulator
MEELSQLLLALYQAAREIPPEQFQDWALELIKRFVPFDSSWWGSGILSGSGVDVHAIHLHNLPDKAEVLAQYSQVAHQDTAALTVLTHGGGVRAYDSAVFAAKESSGIRGFQKRIRIENVLLASDFDRNTRMARWISLFRADSKSRFTDLESRISRLLIPHLLEALEINRLTHLEHLARDPVGRRYCLAIADRRGYLYHAEAGFLQLIQAERSILVDGRIDEVALRALDAGDRYLGQSLVLRATRSLDLLFLRARPLNAMDLLSPREREIARLIAEGSSYKDIARQLHITPATARNHIAAIHAKTAVKSNAELAARRWELD